MAGTLDKNFGITGPGYTLTAIGGEDAACLDQLVDNTGRVIVTGKSGIEFDNMYLARFTSNGELDNTFGDNGKGYTSNNFNISEQTQGSKLLFDNKGNILVLVLIGDEGQGYIITRYSKDGLLDTTFGNNGWILVNFSKYLIANNMTLDKSGLILVTGETSDNDSSTPQLFVTRYFSNGDSDTTFANSGIYINNNFAKSSGANLIIDESNRILITGNSANNSSDLYSMILLRLTSSGLIDNTFGNKEGFTNLQIGDKSTLGGCIEINSNGHIVVAGIIVVLGTYLSPKKTDMFITKYTKDGAIDKKFGENGKGYTIFNNIAIIQNAMVIDKYGHILISGYEIPSSEEGLVNFIFLIRYTDNGILDTTFGVDNSGYVKDTFNTYSYAASLSLKDNDSRILVSSVSVTTGEQPIQNLLVQYLNIDIEPICLVAGTPILTDQGIIPIEKIDTNKHSIDNKRILAITTAITPEKNLVCFEANSMGVNCPSQRTVMTPGHEVLYKGKLVQAKHFVGRVNGVHTVPYNGKDVLYNVLHEHHGLMRVNNMILETLHPENRLAKKILSSLTQ